MPRLGLALALLLAGCSDPVPESPEAPVVAEVSSDVSPLVYRCESGAMVEVIYPDFETAIIAYDGRRHDLVFAPDAAASGATYADPTWSWLTSGIEGVLSSRAGGETVERCIQDS